MADDQGCVDLGRACADACTMLYLKLNGKRLYELNQSILDAIRDLNMWVGPAIHTLGDSLTNVMS